MPLFSTSQEWMDQSVLLVKACPTTRVTSKYSLLAPKRGAVAKFNERKRRLELRLSQTSSHVSPSYTITEPKCTSSFELKTYDPVSGVCLKYRTDKAAEIGRLMGALERLSRIVAGLPDIEMPDELIPSTATAVDPVAAEAALPDQSRTSPQPLQEAVLPSQGEKSTTDKPSTSTGGQGKKKKKGKK